MSYNTLKALVNSKVYENTEQRITGGDMNDVLQSAIASLGAHYQMGGLVSPTDQITVRDEPVVFLATTPGTYTYFGGLVVADGEVALLVWSGTAWSKKTPDIATRTEVSQLGQEVQVIDIDISSIWTKQADSRLNGNGAIASDDGSDIYIIVYSDYLKYKKISGIASSYFGYPMVAFYNDTPSTSTLISTITSSRQYTDESFESVIPEGTKYIIIVGGHTASTPSGSLFTKLDIPEEIESLKSRALIEGENPEYIFMESDIEGRLLRGIGYKEIRQFMPQRLENSVSLSQKAYNSLLASMRTYQIPEVCNLEFGEKEIVFSSDDADASTMEDMRCQDYSIFKTPEGEYYMYYLACGSEGYRFWDSTTDDLAPYCMLFAHSSDGITWTRGFPDGVTPPYGNEYPCSIKFTDNNGNPIRALWGPVFRVNDSEYPWRMITSEGSLIMMFSRDGFTWDKSVVIDGTQSRDTISGVVVRGDILKIYTRGWSGTYPPRAVNGYGQRIIVVLYCDIYGNKISPAVPFVDRASNYNAPLAVIDDRREILFPTLYQGESVPAIANCYIVDGTKVKQLVLDNDFLRDSGDVEHPWMSIWFVSGIFAENDKLYMYYNAFDVVHNQLVGDGPVGKLYRVEVKLTTDVRTNNENIN